MIEFMIDLQGGGKAPLYEKIYGYIRDEIAEGRIRRGEKLPSTRLLAENLAVSRSTVEMAYEQLLAEGYIRAEPCRGFFVCDITGLYRLRQSVSHPQTEAAHRRERVKVDFSPNAVDTRVFPFHILRKINRTVLSDDTEELLEAGDRQGEYALRNVIARYLHQARGVNCRAADLILGAGNEYLQLLLTQILGAGRTVLMENPGYPQAYRTFCNAGYRVKTFCAGGKGAVCEEAQRAGADLVYVMPSHQFPMGTVMPLNQRIKLLEWAAADEGRFLIEDDHDSEFRYRGRPIPSLQSIDCHEKVIYLGTFSKSIAPSLRISYMVLPPVLLERYQRVCGFYSVTVPRVQQETLCMFIGDGYFERHLNKMRGVYRDKRDFLLRELKKRDWAGHICGESAGLHILVEVRTAMGEKELCRRAEERGVRISGLSEYMLGSEICGGERGPGLLFGYGKPDEAEMGQGLFILDCILKEEQK